MFTARTARFQHQVAPMGVENDDIAEILFKERQDDIGDQCLLVFPAES